MLCGQLFKPPDEISLNNIEMRHTTSISTIKKYNAMWHSVLPHTQPGMVCGFLFDVDCFVIACAMWCRPVARHETQDCTTLELSRLTHSEYVPRNFGTWSLAKMRKWIRQNKPEVTRLVSYQDVIAHHGTIYKADNWTIVYENGRSASASWSKTRKGRLHGTERKLKTKWERVP